MQLNIKNINPSKIQMKIHKNRKQMNLIICHMQMLKNNKNRKVSQRIL